MKPNMSIGKMFTNENNDFAMKGGSNMLKKTSKGGVKSPPLPSLMLEDVSRGRDVQSNLHEIVNLKL